MIQQHFNERISLCIRKSEISKEKSCFGKRNYRLDDTRVQLQRRRKAPYTWAADPSGRPSLELYTRLIDTKIQQCSEVDLRDQIPHSKYAARRKMLPIGTAMP